MQDLHSTGGNLFGAGHFQGYFPVAPTCCPSIAVLAAASRGEGGGGKAVSDRWKQSQGCSRPALSPPRAAVP